jgi:DsbC/DsbD-like thiol-disulfide interchange protein
MRFALTLMLLTSPATPDEAPDPVKWSVVSAPKEVRPGQIFRVTLIARVTEGWHLYSMQRKDGGPVPTAITLPTPQWFRLAGSIEPPVGITTYDERFEMEVETYIGEAEFVIPIEVPRDAKPGAWKLKLAARYQVCDNHEALPAKTVDFERDIRITE